MSESTDALTDYEKDWNLISLRKSPLFSKNELFFSSTHTPCCLLKLKLFKF